MERNWQLARPTKKMPHLFQEFRYPLELPVTPMPRENPDPHRQEVLSTLQALRGRIRRYVLIEGTASVLVVLGLVFWFSLAADYSLELPKAARAALLAGAAGILICTLFLWVVLRVFREISSRALALVLERRFPSLNDRLITTVELADGSPTDPVLTYSMLRRTADEVSELTRRLKLREVFNVRPLLRATLLAACLLASIVVFGVGFGDVLGLWYRRNVLLAEEYWPRDTDLKLVILAEPGERKVEFKGGLYRHPRGADLTLLVEVPEGKAVPDQVQFNYRLTDRSGAGRDYMSKVGQRHFRHTVVGLHDSLQLRLSGGDYRSRSPYQVLVVNPPRVDEIVLNCLYPAYTGKNLTDDEGNSVREPLAVQGSQIALPAGTDFELLARVNKPLQDVQIQAEFYELRMTPQETRVRISSTPEQAGGGNAGVGSQDVVWPGMIARDGLSFRLPCVLSTKTGQQPLGDAGLVAPLRLPFDSALRITLHDQDDIISGDPARLMVSSIPDEVPRVETHLKGIGTSVTRQAVIPLVGVINDDYGIAHAGFDFRVDAAEEFQQALFQASPGGRKTFDVAERFELLPLDLSLGQKLHLTVAASDADDLTGPHRVQGEKYVFQIVSNDELLALIAVRELNLRRRFEQILEELRGTQKDLLLQRTNLVQAKTLRAETPVAEQTEELKEQLTTIDQGVLTSTERAINGTRKNANETVSIEHSFRDIRDELENNAVPDVKPLLDRIDHGIVTPLHEVNTVDYNQIDEVLARLKRGLDEKADPFPPLDGCVDQLRVTIEHLEAVLAQMLKLETFNEALQLLRDIIKSQEELQNKTNTQRKKNLIGE